MIESKIEDLKNLHQNPTKAQNPIAYCCDTQIL